MNGLTPPYLLSKIKEKLSDHEEKLRDAHGLLIFAQGQTSLAGSLAYQNQANLTALEVQARVYIVTSCPNCVSCV